MSVNKCSLREEPSQINVILQHELPAAHFTEVCTVYKHRLTTFGCNSSLRTAVKHGILFHISAFALLNNYQYNCNDTISSVSVLCIP